MTKFIICCLLIPVFVSTTSFQPQQRRDGLQWMNLEEVQAAMKKQKKPILIDLYTDWCGWCKVMDQKTYSDKRVIDYLQDNFYFVKVNAESPAKISWAGKIYQFNPSYRTNDFAVYLTHGRLSYPTTVIIPADGSEPQPIPGYLTPKQIEIILKYFGEGKYKRIPFDEYQKEFVASW